MAHTLLEELNTARYTEFSGFIDEAKKRHRRSSSASNMYHGDMWDRGRGYIGPVPTEDDENSLLIFRSIKRAFTTRNVVAEVVDRQVDALLSRSPDWKLVNRETLISDPKNSSKTSQAPKSTDLSAKIAAVFKSEDVQSPDTKIDTADGILGYVWTNADVSSAMKRAFTESLITGKGVLRIHLAKKFFRTGAEDFFEAAKYIKVEYVKNECATVLDDDGDKLSIIKIEGKTKGTSILEISFVDDNDKTYIVSLDETGQFNTNFEEENEFVTDIIKKLKEVAQISSPFTLNENITANEISVEPLVTESILQNNRALNLDLSLGVSVLVESGYAEMVVTNVAMETTTVPDPDHPGATVEKPKGLKRGSGILTNLVGEQTIDAEGRTYFEKPSFQFKDPTPLTSFIQGEDLYYRQILAETKQLHAKLTDKADPSGESRIQSRQDFVKKSQKYKSKVDSQGTWVLNTILNLVASAAGRDAYFSEVEAIFDSKVYAGELSAAERDNVIAQYEHDLISRPSAMVLLGTEDPLVEIDLIRADQAEKLELQVRRLEATAQFGNMANNGQPPASELDKQNTQNKTKAAVKK